MMSTLKRHDVGPASSAQHAALALVMAAVLGGLLALLLAPAARAAFGVGEQNFEAGTCTQQSCTYASVEKDHSQAYTQAAGHPPWGITSFELNSREVLAGQREPEGAIKRVRVDVPPGLAADPQALPQCSLADFYADACPANTQVGEDELTVFVAALNATITGPVYDLQQPAGLPLEFGIHVEIGIPHVLEVVNEHILLEGHLDWSGDYHEYFEINNISKSIPVLKSKLLFNGRAGEGNFLTLPSVCSASTTSHLEVESWEGEISRTETHTPAGVEGCGAVPFKPSAELKPETNQADAPDGATAVVNVPQHVGADEINTADIRNAEVTLPEGMTLNPSAAHGLQACTSNNGSCPAASQVGTVAIETDLPPGSLSGNVYLGDPGGGPIGGPPFTLFLDADSPYGVSVRLQGTVQPNPSTGRLTATFTENPPLPFSELILHFKGGALAPLANPLSCETGHLEALFTPYTSGGAALSSTPFASGGCPSSPQFAPTQSTSNSSPNAGAYTSYTFNLQRKDGEQYLSQLHTELPAGLIGTIPAVTPCPEPLAQSGGCHGESLIGTATAEVGAGPEPYPFSGPVFLTGPYDGAPFGLSIPIAAAAGPFDFGTIVTRASVAVDPYTGRVVVSSSLPTILAGVPLRLKSLSVTVNRPNFLLNPTSCAALADESTLGSTSGSTHAVSSAFSVANCGALDFKPSFKASSNGRPSKAQGAVLVVSLTQPPHEANIHSVVAQLPLQLPSRLTTLQKACPEATFAANPLGCPASSDVGSASVSTPVLPTSLTGPAYLVSHGGAAFPDLDLILEGDGVRVILVGNTSIKGGVTSSSFASIPDVPESSFTLSLPMGPHSALAAEGSLCTKPLSMPTTITAQNGLQVKQNTRVSVNDCVVQILSHRVRKHLLVLRVRTFAPGRLTVAGPDVHTLHRSLGKATKITLRIALSRAGSRVLSRHRHLQAKVRVGFAPTQRTETSSAAYATVKFRR